MALYDHGVKFDYPSHNDGFVSHVARRGAEKTSTAGVWLVGLILVATVYGLIKGLANALGLWLLVIPAVLVILVALYMILETRSTNRKRASSPWAITFTRIDGVKVNGAVRYQTKEEAFAAGARFEAVNVGGVKKPLRGYEVRWDGPTRADSAHPGSSGFITTVPQPTPSALAPHPVHSSSAPLQTEPSPLAPVSSPLSGRPSAASHPSAQSRKIPVGSLAKELTDLAALHADGAISDAEFALAKSRLLAGS